MELISGTVCICCCTKWNGCKEIKHRTHIRNNAHMLLYEVEWGARNGRGGPWILVESWGGATVKFSRPITARQPHYILNSLTCRALRLCTAPSRFCREWVARKVIKVA
jgi:hypothetical protein